MGLNKESILELADEHVKNELDRMEPIYSFTYNVNGVLQSDGRHTHNFRKCADPTDVSTFDATRDQFVKKGRRISIYNDKRGGIVTLFADSSGG